MELKIDLDGGTVDLVRPEELQGFAVLVEGAMGGDTDDQERSAALLRLGEVLNAKDVGRLGGNGDAFIRPEALRTLAAGRVGEGWEDQFAGMCAYAASKGWIDESDGTIQAHVEWPV